MGALRALRRGRDAGHALTGAHPSLAWALAAGCALVAVACPNARAPLGGIPPGDVSQLLRLAAMHATAAAALWASQRRLGPAAFEWLAVCLPAWAHLSVFPAALTPLAWVPLAIALLRAPTRRHVALLAGLSASTQIVGAAGWIFHYFERPLLPSLVAVAIALALWVPASLAAAVTARRSAWLLPIAAAAWPLTEWLRGAAMDPPLPGLFLSHATADTGLAWAAVPFGELGPSYLVSLLAFGTGLLWVRTPPARRWASLAAGLALGLLAGWSPSRERSTGETTRVCAVSDPHRLERHRPAFAGGGPSAIRALAHYAVDVHDCELTVFPEYSLELPERDLLPRSAGAGHSGGSPLVAGVYATVRDATGRPVAVRNVVCGLQTDGGEGFSCRDPLDKLVFAPFGEAALFQDSNRLAGLGRWLSRRATGTDHWGLTARRTTGVLEIGGHRIGAALCWEILIPDIFERKGIAPGAVSLLVVPSDLNGFGGSREAIEQFRRAGRLHTLRLGTPLVFAGTHGSFLLDARGELVPPLLRESFLSVWEVVLPPSDAGTDGRGENPIFQKALPPV